MWTIRGRHLGALMAVSVSLLAGCGSAPPEKPEGLQNGDYSWFQQYMTWFIEREMAAAKITGLSIAVVEDQQVVWREGFGYADKAREIRADADTIYSAGSISKLFTATAAMTLVERGALELDAPITDVLPEFNLHNRYPDAAPVTLRGLLTHHAGMPSDRYHDFILAPGTPEAEVEAKFMGLAGSLGDSWLAREPGSAFSYSNLGFSVAGTSVSRASGQTFADYVREAIFIPAGMSNSSFRRSDVEARLAKGYLDGKEIALPTIRDVPAGALLTSVADLASFMRMVFADGRGVNGEVLRPDTLAEMLRPQNEAAPLDLDFRIGLGWWLDTADDKPLGRMAAHGGDLPPYHAALITLPDSKLGVVVLSNSEESAQVVMSIAFEAARRALEAQTGTLPPSRDARPTKLGAAALDGHTGVYVSGSDVVRVERSGGALQTQFSGTPLHLIPNEDGRFSLEYRLLGVIPISVEQLTQLSVSFHEVGERKLQAMRFGPVLINISERIEPQPELSPAWKDRLGRYAVVNANGPELFRDPELSWDADKKVMVLGVDLVLARTAHVAVAAAPVSDTEAVTLGVGRSSGELLRCPDAETCWFSGFELRRRR